MDPYVEDHLLREIHWLDEDDGPTDLRRMAEACAAGQPLEPLFDWSDPAHEFALGLDALLAVGALTAQQAAAFLDDRLRGAARSVTGPTPEAVDGYLRQRWPGLEAADAQGLISGLHELGVLDEQAFEQWYVLEREGTVAPLPDEADPGRTLVWLLHLRDDAGTAYRGRVEDADVHGPSLDGLASWSDHAFAPRPPAGATGLRLVDAAGATVVGLG